MKKAFFIIIHFDWFAGCQILWLDKEKNKSYKIFWSAWRDNEVAAFIVWFYDYSTYWHNCQEYRGEEEKILMHIFIFKFNFQFHGKYFSHNMQKKANFSV